MSAHFKTSDGQLSSLFPKDIDGNCILYLDRRFYHRDGSLREQFFKAGGGLKDEIDTGICSDRLHQWDPGKYNSLCKKHFGNAGQYWGDRKPDAIAAFMSDYMDKPVRLIKMTQSENRSNGYPYWTFAVAPK